MPSLISLPAESPVVHEARKTVDISVIVPTYNRGRALWNTIECLLRQDPAPREIIVIDQSTIHSPDIRAQLEAWGASGQIVYLAQPEPNAQQARNRGISIARGEVLLLVDDDVEMDSTLVGAHWRNYANPEIGAVAGYYTEPGETPVSELPKEYSRPATGWIYSPHCYTQRATGFAWPSCNGSVRRKLAIQAGGFDENFTHTLLDDTDFSCRLKAAGARVVHDPDARLVHLKIPSGGRRPGRVNSQVIADSTLWYTWCYFFWMNFGWSSWREILIRFRGCVLRKKFLIRPWCLMIAMVCFIKGGLLAALAMQRGRKLSLREASEA